MSDTILVTRPSYDSTTRYISSWAEKVIQVAKSKGNTVLGYAASSLFGKRRGEIYVI